MPVYFAQALDGGPVKIGWSSHPEARVRLLSRALGKPLRILTTTPGCQVFERGLHDILRKTLAKGIPNDATPTEWFHPSAALAELIHTFGGELVGVRRSKRMIPKDSRYILGKRDVARRKLHERDQIRRRTAKPPALPHIPDLEVPPSSKWKHIAECDACRIGGA
jgi:hypothetical protein